MPKILVVLALLLLACPPTHYSPFYQNVTAYKINQTRGTRTPKGILVVRDDVPISAEFLLEIDHLTDQLDTCLQTEGFKPIKRAWFGVFVPKNTYVSTCSGQTLIPSTPPIQGCLSKGLPLPKQCAGLLLPKPPECPCICSVRATVQDDYWIVTVPSLLLYKAELARLTTGRNNIYLYEKLSACAR